MLILGMESLVIAVAASCMDEAGQVVVAEIWMVTVPSRVPLARAKQPPAFDWRVLKILAASCLMSRTQHDSHTALAVQLGGCVPVDFVGADYAGAAAGQFIADAAILIGVVADRQNHASFQHKDGHAWGGGCGSAADRIFRDIAGVGDLRNLFQPRFARGDSYGAHRQLRIRIIRLPGAGALVGALIEGVILDARAPEEMPVGAVALRDLWNLHVSHEAQSEHALALQRWARAAGGKHDDLPGPERRNHPFDNVARGVAFAADVAIFIDFIAARGDHFGVERHIALRQSDAVEDQLQVAFAPEMTGLLRGLEMSDKVGPAGKGLLSELGDRVQMAEHRIANGGGR